MSGESGLAISSFAKINWILKILGRRPDHFHEVRTVLQTIGLCDRITLQPGKASGVELTTSGRSVAAGEANLVYRAASLLMGRVPVSSGVRIHLEKTIPVGAGLGGGSSNAAVTLLALNTMWGGHLSRRELWELASLLGSDVPFFLTGGTCLAEGRGELLTPIEEVPEQELLLLYPRLQISTKHAYGLRDWGTFDPEAELTIGDPDTTISRFRDAVGKGLSFQDEITNDFDGPTLRNFPVLGEAARVLEVYGCERVMLCGSGSTLLGMAKGDLSRTAEIVRNRDVGDVFHCRTLSRAEYERHLTQAGIIRS